MQPAPHRIKLWDLPTRLGHWLVVIAVTAAIITGLLGGEWMTWHGRVGLFICGWLTFRLIWGVIGSTYAQFRQFIPNRAAIVAYLLGTWHGTGHNPLGALSVVALLTLLGLQTASGLVADDDIAFRGPLSALVSSDLSATLTSLHRQSAWVLIALIALHIIAIALYTRLRNTPLVRQMFTGWHETSTATAQSARGGGAVALIVALALAAVVTWGASGGWLSIESSAPPITTPEW
ncbi:cytochrome b/b6 domain-containing protein [Thiospirillum jenense]|uniref:Cytochrome b/b6 domain-containing protein n=2 Tax=Thiospirillum jenense TaxID=1653858 RepID=A0A839HE74_9GAMM|nr:cytochrome b/b6 domain-containing protein [Thiospirillum jenense]